MTIPTMKLIPCSRKNCSRLESQSDQFVSPVDQKSKNIVESAFQAGEKMSANPGV